MAAALVILTLALMVLSPEQLEGRGVQRSRDGPGGLLQRVRGCVHARADWSVQLPELAADVQLYAACVAGGVPGAASASIVAGCSHSRAGPVWETIANLSAIGVPAARAWEHAAGIPGLEELGHLVASSQDSGSRIVEGAGRIAESLRAKSADAATTTAERAGVLIALPLTLCFLPSFLILGLAPVIIGLAGRMF